MRILSRDNLLFLGLWLIALTTFLWQWSSFWVKTSPMILADEFVFASVTNGFYDGASYSHEFYALLIGLFSSLSSDVYFVAKSLNLLFGILLALLLGVWAMWAGNWGARAVALWFPISVMLIPTAMYLPEIPYHFFSVAGLSVLCWAMITHNDKPLLFSVVAGASVGIGALIKPHALFVLVLAAVAVLVVGLLGKEHNLRKAIQLASLFLLVGITTRMIVAIVLGANKPLSLFGAYLDSSLSPNTQQVDWGALESDVATTIPSMFSALAASALLYISIGLLLFGPGLFISLQDLASQSSDSSKFSIPLFLTSFVAFGMLAMSWVFGAFLTSNGDDHSGRVLLRYSEFLLPISLLFLGARVFDSPFNKAGAVKLSMLAGLPVFGLLGLLFFSLGNSTLQLADSLFFLSLSGQFLTTLLFSFAMIAAIFISFRSSLVMKASVVGFLIAGLVGTSVPRTLEIGRFYLDEQESRSEVMAALQTVPSEDKIIFAGFSRATLTSIMLESERFSSDYVLLNGYSKIPSSRSKNYDWVFTQSETYAPDESEMVFFDGEFGLFKVSNDLDLESQVLSRMKGIEAVGGVGTVTNWGFWSEQGELEIVFDTPLKSGSTIELGLIRHQGTGETQAQIFISNNQYDIDMPQAGYVYEATITVSEEDVDSITVRYSDEYDVVYSMGQTKFSIGMTDQSKVFSR